MWIFVSNKAIFIKVLGPKWHKKDILRTKSKKIIVEFKIGSLEYLFVSIFILNKRFVIKIVQKKYFWDEI